MNGKRKVNHVGAQAFLLDSGPESLHFFSVAGAGGEVTNACSLNRGCSLTLGSLVCPHR